jgi:UDP-glucose:(heptosyl)LPS alpha-1,3-glucosyltransferase
MRLAFVLFNWFPFGGLQRDLIKVIDACRDRADISVFCMEWAGERPAGINVREVPVDKPSTTRGRQAFAEYIQANVAGQFDCVVGFNRMPGLDCYFAADTCFAWKAFHERGWWYRQTPRAKQYLKFEEAVFAPGGKTRIFLLSPLQRQQYQQMYRTEAARLTDLPPGISRVHMAPDNAAAIRAAFRAEFNLRETDLLLLQIGSSFNTKGLDRSLQAVASLPDNIRKRLVFFMLGQDRQEEWLKMAASLGLQAQLRILPSRDDITRFMQGADLLIHPSRQESAGMVILEAVVAGLPVLTTANCGYACHVTDSGAGLVCSEPFSQQQLNGYLLGMLESDRSGWKAAGINYGRSHDLYSMPRILAEAILEQRDG